jgi:hypothetical protein
LPDLAALATFLIDSLALWGALTLRIVEDRRWRGERESLLAAGITPPLMEPVYEGTGCRSAASC